MIQEILYDYFGKARPNRDYEVLADWETRCLLKTVITQNGAALNHEACSQDIPILVRQWEWQKIDHAVLNSRSAHEAKHLEAG